MDAEAAVIDAIRQNPAGYYVNVHTPELPKARSVSMQASSQLPFTGIQPVAAGIRAEPDGCRRPAARRRPPLRARSRPPAVGPRRRAATPGSQSKTPCQPGDGRRGPTTGPPCPLSVEPPWGHTPPVPSGQR